jgi:uncharacterized protein with HEPN domain
VSRHNDQRLTDILASAAAIANHTSRGGLEDGLVYDAVRVRLIEIGEAVKSIDPDPLAHEPSIPWIDIAGMRNHSPTATSTPPTASCKPPSPATYHLSSPRSSDR